MQGERTGFRKPKGHKDFRRNYLLEIACRLSLLLKELWILVRSPWGAMRHETPTCRRGQVQRLVRRYLSESSQGRRYS